MPRQMQRGVSMTAAMIYIACAIWIGLITQQLSPLRSVALYSLFIGAAIPLLAVKVLALLLDAIAEDVIELVVWPLAWKIRGKGEDE